MTNSTEDDKKLKEYGEVLRLIQHHDTIMWIIASILLPASITAAVYALGRLDKKLLAGSALGFSVLILLYWLVIANRLRWLEMQGQERAKELEHALGFDHIKRLYAKRPRFFQVGVWTALVASIVIVVDLGIIIWLILSG